MPGNEEIAELVALVGERVSLKRQGARWIGLCPFHNEKTPSFHVFQGYDKPRFHCHGCGESGDGISWLIKTAGLTFRQAKERLGQPIENKPRKLRSPYPVACAKCKADGLTLCWCHPIDAAPRAAVQEYRDKNPDCSLPDWAIGETSVGWSYRPPTAKGLSGRGHRAAKRQPKSGP